MLHDMIKNCSQKCGGKTAAEEFEHFCLAYPYLWCYYFAISISYSVFLPCFLLLFCHLHR